MFKVVKLGVNHHKTNIYDEISQKMHISPTNTTYLYSSVDLLNLIIFLIKSAWVTRVTCKFDISECVGQS